MILIVYGECMAYRVKLRFEATQTHVKKGDQRNWVYMWNSTMLTEHRDCRQTAFSVLYRMVNIVHYYLHNSMTGHQKVCAYM